MFERFTQAAKAAATTLAQEEARALKHNYIGTEHLLLGLLRGQEDIASDVLAELGITLEAVRGQVARIVGHGDEVTTGQIPFTPRSRKVLELALRESLSLGHNYIGLHHILLGIVRENEGVAARILLDFDVSAEKVRNEIIRQISAGPRRAEPKPEPTRITITVKKDLCRSLVDYREGEGSSLPDDHPVSELAAIFKERLT